jgi:hypothetical protein
MAAVPSCGNIMTMLAFICSYHSRWFLRTSFNMLLYIASLVCAFVVTPVQCNWSQYVIYNFSNRLSKSVQQNTKQFKLLATCHFDNSKLAQKNHDLNVPCNCLTNRVKEQTTITSIYNRIKRRSNIHRRLFTWLTNQPHNTLRYSIQ